MMQHTTNTPPQWGGRTKDSIQQGHAQNVKRPVGLACGHGVQNVLSGQPEVQLLAKMQALTGMLALLRRLLSICASFSRSMEMVCGLPVDPMIVKNLGYRRWTLKGPSYGGWRGRQTASLRTKTWMHLCNSVLTWDFRLVWCRGCLACICCKVVRSLEQMTGGQESPQLGQKTVLGFAAWCRTQAQLCSIQGPLWHRMYAEENHGEGLYPPCGGGDRHEGGLELAVEPFDKFIGCGVVSCGH